MSKIPVQVTVDTDELREWAQRHADAGHHGVAHVLYQAAAGIESIPEQHDRELREQVAREIEERRADLLDPDTPGHLNIVHPSSWVSGTRWAENIARGERP